MYSHTRRIYARDLQVETALSAMERWQIAGNEFPVRILEQIIHRTVRHLPNSFVDESCQRLLSSNPQTILELGDVAVDRGVQRTGHVEIGNALRGPQQQRQ